MELTSCKLQHMLPYYISGEPTILVTVDLHISFIQNSSQRASNLTTENLALIISSTRMNNLSALFLSKKIHQQDYTDIYNSYNKATPSLKPSLIFAP